MIDVILINFSKKFALMLPKLNFPYFRAKMWEVGLWVSKMWEVVLWVSKMWEVVLWVSKMWEVGLWVFKMWEVGFWGLQNLGSWIF